MKRIAKNAPKTAVLWPELAMPLEINAQSAALLADLQANVLKGHGRENAIIVFLRITDASAFRAWLKRIEITNAETQLAQTARFKIDPKTDTGTLRCIAFSAAGLQALGHITDKLFNAHNAFRQGMSARTELKDPASNELHFHNPHVWLLLADQSLNRLEQQLAQALDDLGNACVLLRTERGRVLRNEQNEGIEHFGYVDGRSQPLFLKSDMDDERSHSELRHFNPQGELAQVLIPDPLAPKQKYAAGSFLVFRKLEQNVAAFKAREEELADQLALKGEARERAGAMVVGRSEDGTPLASSATALGLAPPNDFNYAQPGAARCPVHAHIRKVNHRAVEVVDGKVTTMPDTRFLMARRGIPFGTRSNMEAPFPTGGVGLMFAAYMADIETQFERAQMSWANTDIDSATGEPGTGADGVIGQGIESAQRWATGHGAQCLSFGFANFVKMRGGDYFYAPSITGLSHL